MAASKCRLRKLERISVLDAQAQTLKSDNERLAALADKLRYIIRIMPLTQFFMGLPPIFRWLVKSIFNKSSEDWGKSHENWVKGNLSKYIEVISRIMSWSIP